MNRVRAVLLMIVLCLSFLAPAASALAPCATDDGHGASVLQADGGRTCCDDTAHGASDPTCDGSACVAHCPGVGALATPLFPLPGGHAHVLAAASVRVPPQAPVFRDERPPRRSV